MGQCAGTAEALPTGKPKFHYMPIAGRGEVIRMTASLGGLEMEETDGADINKPDYGSPSGLPVFEHGDMKLSQAPAILSYIINISPQYSTLTSAQKAKDHHIHAMVMDIMDGGVPPFFAKDEKQKELIGATLDKWYPLLEGLAPSEDKFFNGLSFPTAADFAIVVLKEGHTPFIGLCRVANKDPWAACPKLTKLYNTTMEFVFEGVKVQKFVSESKSMKGNPFGFPK